MAWKGRGRTGVVMERLETVDLTGGYCDWIDERPPTGTEERYPAIGPSK